VVVPELFLVAGPSTAGFYLVMKVLSNSWSFFISPASLEFAEGAEKSESFFKKSLRGRFLKTAHASGEEMFHGR
jgi:hypothetical protein